MRTTGDSMELAGAPPRATAEATSGTVGAGPSESLARFCLGAVGELILRLEIAWRRVGAGSGCFATVVLTGGREF